MKYDEQKELDRLLEGIDEPAPDREKKQRVLRLLDRKTGLSTSEKRGNTVRMNRRRWVAAAVAAVMALCLGAGSIALAENAEYNRAVEFFETNGLSTEGLTRSEIKLIYRDITTESYTYSKTAEVLAHTAAEEPVAGYELSVPESDYAVDLGAELDKMLAARGEAQYTAAIYNESVGVVRKTVDREIVWTRELPGFICFEAYPAEDGIYVSGARQGDNGIWNLPGVVKLTYEGELLWTVSWGEDYEHPDMTENDIWSLTVDPEGGVTAFTSYHDIEKQENGITVTKLSADGETIFSRFNPTEIKTVSEAYTFDGGYLAKVYNTPSCENGVTVSDEFVMRFNADGSIAEEYFFNIDGMKIAIKDIAEGKDKLYVSVTAVNTNASEKLVSLADASGYVQPEAFEPYMDEVVSALLFILDENTGAVLNYYEVRGALGAEVSAEAGVEWIVEKLVSAQFKPEWNRLGLGAVRKLGYSFGGDGVLKDVKDMGGTKIIGV